MSILAAAYEAVLGRRLSRRAATSRRARSSSAHFAGDARREPQAPGHRDYKTRLQELTQRLFRETPVYTLVEESGPDHEKHFVIELAVGGRVLGRGVGRSKKAAEQAAAMEALAALDPPPDDR